MAISVRGHFEETRTSLVALYKNSRVANHGTVQGSLREGFVRSVLQGHVGDAVAWSTGQIVTKAPNNDLSGQLDLIAHRGTDPQVYIQDQFLRLIPSAAALAVVEVKSDLTTGDMTGAGSSNVLKQALDTLVNVRCSAVDLPSTAQSLAGRRAIPTFLVAYKTGQLPKKVIGKTASYLQSRGLTPADFWPTAIVVLEGPKKQANGTGYGLFRDPSNTLAPYATAWSGLPAAPVPLRVFNGGDAVAALVCEVVRASGATVDLEGYVFS